MGMGISAYGLDVNGILSKFGSGDRDYIAKFAGNLSPEEMAVLNRAVTQGAPFADLDEEGWDHIAVIEQLFRNTSPQTWGDVTFGYLWLAETIKDDLLPHLDETSKEMISYFVHGRPIFGKKFGVIESFYGYLDAHETKRFNDSFSRFKLPEPDSPEWDDLPMEILDAPYAEFTAALADLLSNVVKEGQGLAITIG